MDASSGITGTVELTKRQAEIAAFGISFSGAEFVYGQPTPEQQKQIDEAKDAEAKLKALAAKLKAV